jgi:hypothetical protein
MKTFTNRYDVFETILDLIPMITYQSNNWDENYFQKDFDETDFYDDVIFNFIQRRADYREIKSILIETKDGYVTNNKDNRTFSEVDEYLIKHGYDNNQPYERESLKDEKKITMYQSNLLSIIYYYNMDGLCIDRTISGGIAFIIKFK